VEEVVNAFCQVFKDELVALVFYSSYARREQKKSSDIDLLVVLKKIDGKYEVFKKYITKTSIAPEISRLAANTNILNKKIPKRTIIEAPNY